MTTKSKSKRPESQHDWRNMGRNYRGPRLQMGDYVALNMKCEHVKRRLKEGSVFATLPGIGSDVAVDKSERFQVLKARIAPRRTIIERLNEDGSRTVMIIERDLITTDGAKWYWEATRAEDSGIPTTFDSNGGGSSVDTTGYPSGSNRNTSHPESPDKDIRKVSSREEIVSGLISGLQPDPDATRRILNLASEIVSISEEHSLPVRQVFSKTQAAIQAIKGGR